MRKKVSCLMRDRMANAIQSSGLACKGDNLANSGQILCSFTHILLLTDRSNEQKSIRIMWQLIIKGHRER